MLLLFNKNKLRTKQGGRPQSGNKKEMMKNGYEKNFSGFVNWAGWGSWV